MSMVVAGVEVSGPVGVKQVAEVVEFVVLVLKNVVDGRPVIVGVVMEVIGLMSDGGRRKDSEVGVVTTPDCGECQVVSSDTASTAR